jgi:hypothetical protein
MTDRYSIQEEHSASSEENHTELGITPKMKVAALKLSPKYRIISQTLE